MEPMASVDFDRPNKYNSLDISQTIAQIAFLSSLVGTFSAY